MINSCSPDHWRLSLAPVLSRFCSIAFNVRTSYVQWHKVHHSSSSSVPPEKLVQCSTTSRLCQWVSGVQQEMPILHYSSYLIYTLIFHYALWLLLFLNDLFMQCLFFYRDTENGESLSDQVLLHQLTVNLSRQYIQLISM